VKFEDYIKKLEQLKSQAERAMVANLPAIEQQALQLITDFIDDNLDTKDGKLVANDRAVVALQNFTDVYLGALAELSDYKGAVGQFLKNFKDMGTLMNDFHKANGLDVKAARLGAVQELVVGEIVNQYSENGLNPGFVQPLRELLFDNITGGLNKKEAMVKIREYIASGKDTTGKLGRYIEQTAQQGVDSYTGAINTRIMQTFSVGTFIMSGSLIATSSKQCRYCIEKLGGILDRKDWPKIKEVAGKELIKGTTFENLPINKLHWGCRHEFTPVVLTEKQRENLLKNPVNN
jgi:hypothetical protein